MKNPKKSLSQHKKPKHLIANAKSYSLRIFHGTLMIINYTNSSVTTVENVNVLYDKESGRARGLGSVEFFTREEAQALDEASNLTVDGRTLLATFSDQKDANKGPQQSLQEVVPTVVVAIHQSQTTKAIDTQSSSVTLASRLLIKAYIRIANDRDTGKSKGFCNVDFDSANADEKARGKTGQQLDGREVRVDA
jgi:RNA recognition motif-containing protein